MKFLECDVKTTVTGLAGAVAMVGCWVLELTSSIVVPERIYIGIVTIVAVLIGFFAKDSDPKCEGK